MLKRNEALRVALYESVLKQLEHEINELPNVNSVSKSVCEEVLDSGKIVQIQITIATEEVDFIDAFTTVVVKS